MLTQPELRRLPLAVGERNPIHDLLDAVGLPWRESLATLLSRYGPGTSPIFLEPVVAFPDAVVVPGLLCLIDTAGSGAGPDGATTEEEIRDTPSVGHALRRMREPRARFAKLLRRIGQADDRRALIFCTGQLYVVPTEDIVGFRTERMLPARGPGGSSLHVECRRPGASASPTSIRLDAGPGPDDMNGPCTEYARLFGRPAVIGECYPDE